VLGTKVDWPYCVEENSAVLDSTAFQIGKKIMEPHDRPWQNWQWFESSVLEGLLAKWLPSLCLLRSTFQARLLEKPNCPCCTAKWEMDERTAKDQFAGSN
jgi:hypothetical protein